MKRRIKKYGPYILLGLCFLMLLFLNILYLNHWLDSDMAAEMIFSKQLAEGKHIFASPDWYYSTEFRFLYTHLLMGPLFLIIENWHIIRMLTNIVFYILLVASYFYFMKPLRIQSRKVVLTAVILLLPFSETLMLHMQMGNTYMSHVIILFFFFGMFLRLTRESDLKKGRKYRILILYMILAVICGVSGVRYLLALQCPLLLTAFFYVLKSDVLQNFRKKSTMGNFILLARSNAAWYLYYSIIGVLGGVIGYGINVLFVSRHYSFQTYDVTNFIGIYQGVLLERLQDAIGSLLMLFGYIPDRGVLSLRGIITMIAFVLIGLVIYCTVRVYKKAVGNRFFVVLFLIVTFLLNSFMFIFTTSTLVPRYYITVMVFMLPVFTVYFEEERIAFDKWVVGLLLSICLLASTGKTALSFITTDKNADKYQVADFLKEEGYQFGLATYWNGNIITELTNGSVEIANVGDPEYLSFFKWSSPKKYYEEGYYEGEVFLLVTAKEASDFAMTQVLQNGERIYEDEYYIVLLYDSVNELKGYAAVRKNAKTGIVWKEILSRQSTKTNNF